MGHGDVAASKKNAARRRATLVFLDEAGFLMAPLARRTWAPRGETPVLTQRTRAHQKVSAIAAVVIPPRRDRVRCFFRLAPDANFDGPRIVAFLQHLRRTLRGPIVLIWDRLQAHRGACMQAYLRRARDLTTQLLPPYAPERNPVELIWGHAKRNGLANFAPLHLTDLTQRSHATTRSIARRQPLLRWECPARS